jgi:hypothetical protein
MSSPTRRNRPPSTADRGFPGSSPSPGRGDGPRGGPGGGSGPGGVWRVSPGYPFRALDMRSSQGAVMLEKSLTAHP